MELTGNAPAKRSQFSAIADSITAYVGSSMAFNIALGVIVIWLAVGPLCGYSDTWQLTVNTGTSIITFLMVFLIQKTQNRDTGAIHLKLNELIAAVDGASNRLISVETLDEEAMNRIANRFKSLAEVMRGGGSKTGTTSVEEVPEAAPDAA